MNPKAICNSYLIYYIPKSSTIILKKLGYLNYKNVTFPMENRMVHIILLYKAYYKL